MKSLFLLLILEGRSLCFGAAAETAALPSKAEAPSRPPDFGRQWVRSHPFTLMALTQRPAAVADDQYVQAGFGTMLAWKNRAGLFERALLEGEEEGKPTPLYYDASRLNVEVANLGKALRFLTSTGVCYVAGPPAAGGGTNPAPEGLEGYQSGKAGPDSIRSISVDRSGPDGNGLVGFFKDDPGRDYFLLVNLRHGEGLSAAAGEGTMTVRLSPAVEQVTRLSRATGQPEALPVREGELKVTLPGGTGDLFLLGAGPFPGLE